MLELRKFLLKNTNIIAVISLPRGVFRPYVKENKTDIIVFKKDPKGTKSVWFYNLEADGFDLSSDFRRPIPENDIPDLQTKWNAKAVSQKSWHADIRTITANNYKLIAKEYEPKERAIASQFPIVQFSSIMREAKTTINIDDAVEYRRIKVAWYGQGITFRDKIKGKEITVKEQKVTQAEQFVVAEIDAKMGSYGVIPSNLSGSIVSSHYFLFDLDKSRVKPEYVDYITRFGHYEELVRRFVKGTTNYADIRPSDVLQLTLPLPSLEEQARIVEEIDRQVRIKEDSEKTLESLETAAVDDHFFKSAVT